MNARFMPPPRQQLSMFDDTLPLRQTRHMDELPETAHALIEVIGLQATIDLVKVAFGDEIRVPAVVDGDSRAWAMLEEAVGRDAAAKLVNSHLRDTIIYVPICKAALLAARNRDIAKRIDAGEDFDAVRRAHRMTRSALYRVLKKSGG